MAQISAELDEERDKSTSLKETVTNLQKTNEELCESQMSLQTKLVQRYIVKIPKLNYKFLGFTDNSAWYQGSTIKYCVFEL